MILVSLVLYTFCLFVCLFVLVLFEYYFSWIYFLISYGVCFTRKSICLDLFS